MLGGNRRDVCMARDAGYSAYEQKGRKMFYDVGVSPS